MSEGFINTPLFITPVIRYLFDVVSIVLFGGMFPPYEAQERPIIENPGQMSRPVSHYALPAMSSAIIVLLYP